MDRRSSVRRLKDAPAARRHNVLLCDTLKAVEDEHSNVPNNPAIFRTTAGFIKPQPDRSYEVDGFPEVIRYRSPGTTRSLLAMVPSK